MTADLTALVVLLVLVLLALTAPRWGTDSRSSREWSQDGPVRLPGGRG
jgi:hypothetical protein